MNCRNRKKKGEPETPSKLSVSAKRDSRSRSKSISKSPDNNHRKEIPKRLDDREKIRVATKRGSRSRSKTPLNGRNRKNKDGGEAASKSSVSAQRDSQSSSKSISQSLDHHPTKTLDNRKKVSVTPKRRSRTRSKSRSRSPKTPNKTMDISVETPLSTSLSACDASLTFDDREEEAPSSGQDAENILYKGPNLFASQSDRPPPSRRKSVRKVTPQPVLVDQGRQTRQSCKKKCNSVTVSPAEGRPLVPSAPDSNIKLTFASNPHGITISQFNKLIDKMGMKLVTVPGNGFCFISCVLVTLAEQGINKTIDVLSVEIMIEINNHITHYKQYGNQEDMTTFQAKCADYFQKGIYDSDAVDICIGATANALGVNVHVLQKGNDKKLHLSSYECLHSSSTDIYLHHYPSKVRGKSLDAHFNCYVKKDYYKKNSKSIASRFVRTDEGSVESNTAETADQR